MKKILFPTDFSAQSLNILEQFIKNTAEKKLTIVLFAGFSMPDSEQDVIGFGNKPHQMVLNEVFRKGCRRLKEKHAEKLANIYYKYMYGNSRNVFRNYLDSNEIDQILFPDGMQFSTPHARFINPGSLVLTAPLTIIRTIPAPITKKPKAMVMIKKELTVAY